MARGAETASYPHALLHAALRDGANDSTPPRAIETGESSTSARVTTGLGAYFAKWGIGHDTLPRFEAEARGLALLRRADTGLVVPQVIGLASDETGALLLLGWLESVPATAASAAALGEGLTRLHRHLGEQYGLAHDNFIGATPQRNDWHDDWPTFFGEQRLLPLAERLTVVGRWPASHAPDLERLLARLPDLLPHDPPPSLLHGDLWGGNWLALPDGGAALIDPAPSFGDREADLAMTHLFGGFPPEFYDAYHAAWPPEPAATERIPLYNLYHLLNHLLLFGNRYAPSVERLLAKYR